MLNNELNRAESIPDIHYFVRLNKYNQKVDIEIKILEPLEAFLIYNKKSICFLSLESPTTHNVVGELGLRPKTPTMTLCQYQMLSNIICAYLVAFQVAEVL